MSDWQEVTRAAPCIVCGKPDWCGRTVDGSAIRCMRSDEPPPGYRRHKTNPDDGGTTFLRNDQPRATANKRTEGEKPAQTQFDSSDAAVGAMERTLGKASAKWTYRDADGEPVGMVIRWDLRNGGKDIRPIARIGSGWQIKAMPGPRPLYCLPDLRNADLVFVTEGEPAADALRKLGLVATTSSGGSRAASKTDWSPLGDKRVVILPDNDRDGERYRDDVFRLLNKLEPRPVIKTIALPDLPAKGDSVQFVEARRKSGRSDDETRAELLKMVNDTEVEDEDSPGAMAWKPFPVELLPTVIRDLAVEGGRAIGIDPALVAVPALVTCGTALGMTAQLRCTNEWKAPPILWGAAIARSGCRKSPAFRLATQILQDVEDEAQEEHRRAKRKHAEDMARWKAAVEEWERGGRKGDRPKEPPEPIESRHVISDVTVEVVAQILQKQPRGVVVLRDEVSGFFHDLNKYRNGKGGDAQNWIELWHGRVLSVDRVSKPRIRVSGAAVSVLGTVQPRTLRRLMTPELLESGFLSRWLFVMPPSGKRQRPTDVDSGVRECYEKAVRALLDLELRRNKRGRAWPREIPFSKEAESAWWRFFDRHAVRQDAALDEVTEAGLVKLEEIALRLALIFWAVRKASKEIPVGSNSIDVESMRNATDLVDWFAYEHERILEALRVVPDRYDEVDVSKQKAALIEFIRGEGGSVTTRMVIRGRLKRVYKNSAAAKAALEELVDTGVAKVKDIKSGPRGGGSQVRYSLLDNATESGNGDTTSQTGESDDTTPADDPKNKVVSPVTAVTEDRELTKDRDPTEPKAEVDDDDDSEEV